MNPIEYLIRHAKNPVAFTGAGISQPSGIPTFQEASWKGKPVREYLSRKFFESNPKAFWELFAHMTTWLQKEPNPAHEKLAGWGIPIITQNVDGLHQKAGSEHVIELHGSLASVRCPFCGTRYDSRTAEFLSTYHPERIPFCESCGHMLDTDMVLYGDEVPGMNAALKLTEQCDLLLVIGTSLQVYPAASVPQYAFLRGASIITVDDCLTQLSDDYNGVVVMKHPDGFIKGDFQ